MSTLEITCPRCQEKFLLTAAMEEPLRARLREELVPEREAMRAELERSGARGQDARVRELEARLSVMAERLESAEQHEITLRRERAELEARQVAFDLELSRNAERIMEQVRREKDDEYRLRESEAQMKQAELNRQIDDLKRRAAQSTPQIQGEVLELDLETALRRSFPRDAVDAVDVGSHGGDVVLRVREESGAVAGTLLFEVKNTKNWNDTWLPKLRADLIESRADLAILVTTSLPRGVAHFEYRQGVWVTTPALAVPLVHALRSGIIDAAAVRRSTEGREDKMDLLYDFLASPEFRARVSAMLETFRSMKADLDSERNSLRRIWSKREKQIERLLASAVEMHGSISGIIERPVPIFEGFELAAVASRPNRTDGSDESAGAESELMQE